MVARKRDRHALADDDLAVLDHRSLRTVPTARIAPSGGLMIAAKSRIPIIPRLDTAPGTRAGQSEQIECTPPAQGVHNPKGHRDCVEGRDRGCRPSSQHEGARLNEEGGGDLQRLQRRRAGGRRRGERRRRHRPREVRLEPRRARQVRDVGDRVELVRPAGPAGPGKSRGEKLTEPPTIVDNGWKIGSPVTDTGRACGLLFPNQAGSGDNSLNFQPGRRSMIGTVAGPRYNTTADFLPGVRGFCVPHAA